MNVYISIKARLTKEGNKYFDDKTAEFHKTFINSFVPRVGDCFAYDEDWSLVSVKMVSINLETQEAQVDLPEQLFYSEEEYNSFTELLTKLEYERHR